MAMAAKNAQRQGFVEPWRSFSLHQTPFLNRKFRTMKRTHPAAVVFGICLLLPATSCTHPTISDENASRNGRSDAHPRQSPSGRLHA
jgi:hypothetical protein